MLRTTLLKWIGTGALGGALLLSVALQDTSAQGPSQIVPTATATTGQERQPGGQERQPGRNPGQGGQRVEQALRQLVQITAELSGLTPEQVSAELQAGKTLAQIASEHGSSGAAVVDAAVAKAKQRIDQAVSNGRLTQEEADRMLERTRQAAERAVNTPHPGKRIDRRQGNQGRPGQREHMGRALLVEATAEVTGLTVEQVRAELQAGKSLAQIASEHGKTGDDILANLRAKGEQRLDELLERAREAIEKVPER